jgi:hypothetical protein
MDGLDGLAASTAAIAGAFFSIISFEQGSHFIYLASIVLCAASVGFLVFNLPPARIFMGDVGSTFLGFSFAVMAVIAARYDLSHTSLFVVPMLVWAGPLTHLLLGSGYSESASIMRALTPYVYLAGLASLLSVAVNYLGRAAARIPAAISAVIANIAVDLILIPKIGAIAGAIGSAVGFLIYTPGHFVILRSELGFELRPLFVSFVRSFVAGAFMAVPLLLIGTSGVGYPALFAGLAAAAIAYVAGLVVVREMTSADFRFVASRLGTTFRRGGR